MKPAAHLTSRLLARKGEAAPVTTFPTGAASPDAREKNAVWRNMSLAKKAKNVATMKPAAAKASVKGEARVQEDPESRVAMTLRLDARQHKRLRLMSVHSHQSAREIMTAALDLYLDMLEAKLDVSNCECLNLSK